MNAPRMAGLSAAGVPTSPMSEGQYLGRLLESAKAPVVFAGPAGSGDFEHRRAPEDSEVLERIRHVMKKGEHLMEFYVRTGLGRHQILNMGGAEIAHHIKVHGDDEVRRVLAPGDPAPRRSVFQL